MSYDEDSVSVALLVLSPPPSASSIVDHVFMACFSV